MKSFQKLLLETLGNILSKKIQGANSDYFFILKCGQYRLLKNIVIYNNFYLCLFHVIKFLKLRKLRMVSDRKKWETFKNKHLRICSKPGGSKLICFRST